MAFGFQVTQRAGPTDVRPVVDAIGVDSASHDVWAAIGGDLVHLDKDGNVVAYYCLYTTDQAPVRPTTILVEPDRILIGTDSFGVFEYSRPDKPSPLPGAIAPH